MVRGQKGANTMTAQERKIARDLRQRVMRKEPIKAQGTLEEYFTVYTDYTQSCEAEKRGEPDAWNKGWPRSWATRLYNKHGFEYCVLLEVLAAM